MTLFIVKKAARAIYPPFVNPQGGFLREAVPGFPQSFYRDVRSVSAPVLPRSGTLGLGWLNGFKLNNLMNV